MRKINTKDIAEDSWASPKGTFGGSGKEVSIALGSDKKAPDAKDRHPFDVEILRVPPGKAPYPYHSHGAQWEFYHVISGKGVVRDKDGTIPNKKGGGFFFFPWADPPPTKKKNKKKIELG